MKHMRTLTLVWVVIALMMTLSPFAAAQSETPGSCPEIVQFALDSVDALCGMLDEGEACYGHVLVDATPHPGVAALNFNQEGDIEALLKLRTIRLSPMDTINGLWGVALLKLRTYMDYADPEPVTFLLFGDIDIENQTEHTSAIEVTATAYSNVRLRPHASAGVLGVLQPNQSTWANGRSENNEWVRVTLPDTGRVGWTYTPNLRSDTPVEQLDLVINTNKPYYGPMQAFYLRSGTEDAACPESPESGLLIQTPEGVAEITLLVNEVSIQLQATAYIQAQPGGNMTVGLLSGQGWVAAGGVTQPVFAGSQVTISLGEDRVFSGAPQPPEPYDPAIFNVLPLALLNTPVVPPPPISQAQLATLLFQAEAESIGSPSSAAADSSISQGTTTETTTGNDLPPGLNGIAPPGQGGIPPGQGGIPPGQAK